MKLADCNTPEPSPRRKGSRFIVRPDVRWRQVAILDKLMFLASTLYPDVGRVPKWRGGKLVRTYINADRSEETTYPINLESMNPTVATT